MYVGISSAKIGQDGSGRAGEKFNLPYEVAARRGLRLAAPSTSNAVRASYQASYTGRKRHHCAIGLRPSRIAHETQDPRDSTVSCANANAAGASMKQAFDYMRRRLLHKGQAMRLGTRGQEYQSSIQGRDKEGHPTSQCHQRATPCARRTRLLCGSRATPLSLSVFN